MIEIFTSYYAMYKKIPDNYLKVQISQYRPKFIDEYGLIIPMKVLAPSEELLKKAKGGQLSEEEYTQIYFRELKDREVTPSKVVEALTGAANKFRKDAIVLLCYESPDKFCHRHLVADWLNNHLDLNIKEFK